MLYTGTRTSLIELIIFALLAADAIVLLMTVRGKNDEEPGLLQYMSVWILGLIPYFGWAVVYWIGKRTTEIIQRNRGNVLAIALLLSIGIILLCLCTYIFVGDSPARDLPIHS